MSTTPKPEPAVPPAPTTPPPAASTPPAADGSGKLLSTILGLIKPEEKVVTPPTPPTVPATPPAPAPTEPTGTTPTPPPAPEPRKPVKVRAPAPRITPADLEDAVKRGITAATPTPPPAPTPPAPVAPALPSDLTPEERDEVELARYIEGKDPAKKGLADRTLKFFEEQKKFLERRVTEVGDSYDPAEDPQFKKFLEKNQPQLTPSERRRMTIQRETEGIKTEAFEAAKKELMPEIEKTKRKLLEIEERPKVKNRVNKYIDEVASSMTPEVHEFYVKNGRDVEKTKAEYPVEFAIASQVTAGAVKLAEEFLNLRRGLVEFQANNEQHQFMHDFVDRQGKIFSERGGDQLVRNGKTFVHPYQWAPGMEKTHWTFDDDDVLSMLKVQAQLEAKTRIEEEQKKMELAYAARQRRLAAQNGAVTHPPTPTAPPSPTIPAAPSPGAASGDPKPAVNPISRILKIGT